jgi:hypothetical protein
MPMKKFPDRSEFANRFMPPKLPMNWHHQLFYDILDSKIVQQADKKLYINKGTTINNNILMLAPRFHAKSQIFTVNNSLYEIYKNPDIRIIIVSVNEPVAVSFNRAIMNQLLYNQKLIKEMGYLVPEYQERNKWGEKALIVKRKSLEKDPTISAIGVGGGLISKRADLIIVDDLIDINRARTRAARLKTKEWFDNVLLPILEDDGKLIVAGTVWYRDDIYDSLWRESEFDIKVKLKALMYHPKYVNTNAAAGTRYIPYRVHEWPKALDASTLFSEEAMHKYELYTNLKGGVLWPAKWSYQKLMDKKRKGNMSNAAFSRQYLNEPTTEEEKLFKETFIQRSLEKGTQKTLTSSWDNKRPPFPGYGFLIVAVGVDLAISKKKTSNLTSIAVWGINNARERILLWLDFGHWSPDEIKVRLVEVNYNFQPVKMRVENVAYQDMLRQQLDADDLPVEGFQTTSSKKFSEETGIAQVAMLTEQELMVLPSAQSNKDNYQKVLQLISEMEGYSYDQHAGDNLMASWFALDVLKDFDKKMQENRGFFATSAIIDQMRNVRAAHKVVLLGYNPPVFKFAVNSLLSVYRPVKMREAFIQSDEQFFIFATRAEKCVAYILNKATNEIVAKIEGDLTALMFATLLEKSGQFFNKAQIVVDKNGEGIAVLNELQHRFYGKLLCLQPDKNGTPTPREGFEIDESNLPLSVAYFKQQVDAQHFNIPDDNLLKEMGQTIGVTGRDMKMGIGNGQRIKTISTAVWILDNYETLAKKLYNNPKKKKKKKFFKVPYLSFRH